ncbi:RDD family protein [Dictyobacter kobayashii]|uniref:RDD domain-containing protein n=1 Tax=Dictyobacter kobayashii TaxID=2014872 RepID=A0A402AUJ5_9CHLR|nr:RDD family protein [Dictyobacter kobayashii]GCE22719.1 hypothetical protein KDK_65190 [Dictyobacter kobayashii]
MQTPYAQENVQAVPQAYAGVGIRFVAVLIDGIIIGIVSGIITAILGTKQVILGASVDTILYFLYFIILEATMGATLGKKILGLRVVRQDGAPISWSESLIRNLLRIIDGLFAYLLGAIFIWTSPLKQRLGDKAAHTLVVKGR